MDVEEEENYNSKKLIQKQENLQLIRQKQDLVSCNNSFGMLLSSMESLFIKSKYKIEIKFAKYNYFDNRKWKTKEQIKAQLYTDLMGYKLSKMSYIQKYGKFDYPDYPPIDEIIQIVKKWKNIAEDSEEKKLCEEILNLISEKDKNPLSFYQNRIENSSGNNNSTDVIKQFELSNKIHDHLDKRDKKVKEQIEKNPNAKFGLEIGEEEPKEEKLSKSLNLDINEKEGNEIKNQEKTIIEKIRELIRLAKQLSQEKISEKDIKKSLENAEEIIKDYYKEYENIDFLFKGIHKNSTLKTLDEYILKCNNSKKKKIFEKIKRLLTKYDYI